MYIVFCSLTLSRRLTLDVPDSMHMMDEAEGAQDPFFGLMESHQLPSPYKMHQVTAAVQHATCTAHVLALTYEHRGV